MTVVRIHNGLLIKVIRLFKRYIGVSPILKEIWSVLLAVSINLDVRTTLRSYYQDGYLFSTRQWFESTTDYKLIEV